MLNVPDGVSSHRYWAGWKKEETEERRNSLENGSGGRPEKDSLTRILLSYLAHWQTGCLVSWSPMSPQSWGSSRTANRTIPPFPCGCQQGLINETRGIWLLYAPVPWPLHALLPPSSRKHSRAFRNVQRENAQIQQRIRSVRNNNNIAVRRIPKMKRSKFHVRKLEACVE